MATMDRRAKRVYLMRILHGSALLALAASSCGEPVLLPRPETPVTTLGNTPLPDPALNDPPPLREPPSNEFTGTIAELWALQSKASGLKVVIPVAIVTANAGNGERMYVSDPEVLDNSGIEVERCAKDDRTCKESPPARGAQVNVIGTLFTSRDGSAVIGKATVTTNADATPLNVEPRYVVVEQVEKGNLTGNEGIRASLVELVDTHGAAAKFVVSDLTPADDQNGNYPPELDETCGPGKVIPDGVSCCPAGIGPKYYSFVIQEVATGRLVSVGSGNYRDIDFVAFACGARDLAKQIKLGDEFTRFGGIFDVKFGKSSVSPAATSDYVLVRK